VTKITEHDSAAGQRATHHHVRTLDVPVQYVVGMEVPKAARHIGYDLHAVRMVASGVDHVSAPDQF
jgi:hypothetical protein